MDQRCKECGFHPAAYSLDYWHRRFEGERSFCRECAEKLAARIARDGWVSMPLSQEEMGHSHKETST